MRVYQEKARVLKNERVCGPYWKMAFESIKFARVAQPGQFMLVKASECSDQLLRKPLGFHRVEKNSIEALYEVVGRGTEILSRRKPGDVVDVIGPLGNGFKYRSPVTSHQSPVLIAGGIGVAPLVFLAEKLVGGARCAPLHQRPIVLLGAKTKSCVLCEKEFNDLGCDVRIVTDDGSKGHKGFVTDTLKLILLNDSNMGTVLTENCPHVPVTIYACGPRPMLEKLAAIAKRHKIPCQVLLEEYMACGMGVCLGCPVNTKEGYKLVCKDGPVFEAEKVVWE
ncbi:MAG: dihydroorotate dehydrogenase electron transfer subunit [Candidatus Omnitrophica bacterium]|nr:dihydroorotate dehydrogenase electron transfer subunit [Candidatus Omnitrophota bacterium]